MGRIIYEINPSQYTNYTHADKVLSILKSMNPFYKR